MNGPSFFIIGAAKAATTSLSSLLGAHPQGGIAISMEPHFFSYDSNYQRGWELYTTLFRYCQSKKARGDASTSYSRVRYHPAVADRIKKHVPDAKIIYMVRNPLKRMESAYLQHLCMPQCTFTSFDDAIRRQQMIMDSSRYWEVFDAYRKRFDESQIKVVWFEEYIADTTAVFQDVCRFLEIDDTVVPDRERELSNSRDKVASRLAELGKADFKVETDWVNETRQWVINQLRDDNLRFLAHFNRPKDYWGDLF